MILKQEPKKNNAIFRVALWALPLVALIILFSQVSQRAITPIEGIADTLGGELLFLCDMENDNGVNFISNNQEFEGLGLRSVEHAYSDEYSIAISNQSVFGLTTWFKPPSFDATYHLSVKRYNPDDVDSYLVVAAPNSKDLYRSVKEGVAVSGDDDWEVLDILFQVPPGVDSVKIYCYVSEDANGTAYFDDLSVSIQDIQSVGRQYAIPTLELRIEEQGLNQLKQKRTEAWSKGVLIKGEEDWVKAKIIYDQEELKGKLRLKGDWLDHLRGDKWSFRVKLKDPDALLGYGDIQFAKT